jgi:hypothetical protein
MITAYDTTTTTTNNNNNSSNSNNNNSPCLCGASGPQADHRIMPRKMNLAFSS